MLVSPQKRLIIVDERNLDNCAMGQLSTCREALAADGLVFRVADAAAGGEIEAVVRKRIARTVEIHTGQVRQYLQIRRNVRVKVQEDLRPGCNLRSRRWELVSEFPAKDETRFIDDRIEEKGTYNYTVVPFRNISGNKYFGDFDYKGNGISLL